MAATLDFAATVNVLFDYCEIVELVGPLDWESFVQGYREYETRYVGETSLLPKAKADRRSFVTMHTGIA